MDKNNLKNIVVLKNLPSNIVDEAIVILKPNQRIKKIEIYDKNNNKKYTKQETKNNMHVIKEAEMLISNYISELENREGKKNGNILIKEKYERLKKYCFVSSLILLMSLILHFI